MGNMRERMLRNELYLADDPQLVAEMARAQALLAQLHAIGHDARHEQARLLREIGAADRVEVPRFEA